MSVATKKKPKGRLETRPGWMVWGIPKKLKDDFQIRCIRNGTTMRAALQGLLEEYVHGKKENIEIIPSKKW